MNLDQLRNIVDDARNGTSPESSILELKRSWYRFDLDSVKAKADGTHVRTPTQEFQRDVAAMANAHGDGTRWIVFGVTERGQLFDAPLPLDEAALQQKLSAIEPRINVRFVVLQLEGSTVSVLEILSPFERPYVHTSRKQHVVWIRKGTTTATASRSDYVRFNAESRPRPDLRLAYHVRPIHTESRTESDVRVKLWVDLGWRNSGVADASSPYLYLRVLDGGKFAEQKQRPGYNNVLHLHDPAAPGGIGFRGEGSVVVGNSAPQFVTIVAVEVTVGAPGTSPRPAQGRGLTIAYGIGCSGQSVEDGRLFLSATELAKVAAQFVGSAVEE